MDEELWYIMSALRDRTNRRWRVGVGAKFARIKERQTEGGEAGQ